MVYETAVVFSAQTSEETQKKSLEKVKSKLSGAEFVINDDWGVKIFAQPTGSGVDRGHYHYFMFTTSDSSKIAEMERELRLNEDVLKFITIKLGLDRDLEKLKKHYEEQKNSKDPGMDKDLAKERKKFSKRRSCWFSANKTIPDWKTPHSYAWLVNEFGKISPARVTGLRPRYQRMANSAIKVARCMGLISYTSNRTAR